MTENIEEVSALSLTEAERTIILEVFGSQTEFLDWQRTVLSTEIESRIAIRSAQDGVESIKPLLPTLYPKINEG